MQRQTGQRGRRNESTPWFYGLLLTGLIVALVGLAVGSWLLGPSWYQLLIAAGLGFLCTQFAYLAHEASHRQILASGPANDRFGRILAAITRKQGYLFFPLLALEGVNLHWHSLRLLLSPGEIRGRWIELGLILVRFAVLLSALFLTLPVGMACAFLGVQLAVFGICMGAAFAPNHKGMDIIDEHERLDFLSKQVRTSRNLRGGWWVTALFGGLNFQVEHHLFPSMARPQFRRR